MEPKNNELRKHNSYLEKLEIERKMLLQEIKQLEEKQNNLKYFKPNLQDQQMLEVGRYYSILTYFYFFYHDLFYKKKLKLYKDLTKIQWDYEAAKHSVRG